MCNFTVVKTSTLSTLRFLLRTDKCDKSQASKQHCPIYLLVQLKGAKVSGKYKHARKSIATGLKLHPVNWSVSDQRAVYVNRKDAKKLYPDIPSDYFLAEHEVAEINQSLNNLQGEIIDAEKLLQLQRQPYNLDIVIEQWKKKKVNLTSATSSNSQFFNFIDEYIQANEATRQPGSLKVYRALRRNLESYQNYRNSKIIFEDIDYTFFQGFQNFLVNKEGLNNTTTAKRLSSLKTILTNARRNGFKLSEAYKDYRLKKETLEVIALTSEELQRLIDLDLQGHRLDKVRDLFVFACVTGLRVSDILKLKRENVKNDSLIIRVKKTKEQLIIPLNHHSARILSKYTDQHSPLPSISSQRLNSNIKEVAALAGIDEKIEIIRFSGSREVRKVVPKYELLSIHNGRKTFATISLEKGMPVETVMKIGGWRSYSAFSRYINVTQKRTKQVMHEAWGEGKLSPLKAV